MKKLFLFWLLMAIAGAAHAYCQADSYPPKGEYTASFAPNDLSLGFAEKLGSDDATSMYIFIDDVWGTDEEINLSENIGITVANSMYGITKIEIPVTSDSQLEAEKGTLTKNKTKYIWTCPNGEVVKEIEFWTLNNVVINGDIVVTYDTRLQTPATYSAYAYGNDCFGMKYSSAGAWKGGRRIAILPGVSITTGSSDDTNWGVEDVNSSKCASSKSLLEVENGIPVKGTFFKLEPRVNVAVNFIGNFPEGTYCIVDKDGKVVFEKEIAEATDNMNMFEYNDEAEKSIYHSFLQGMSGPYYFYQKDAVGLSVPFGIKSMTFYPVFAYGAKAVHQLDVTTNSKVKIPRVSSDSGIKHTVTGFSIDGSYLQTYNQTAETTIFASWSSEEVSADDKTVADEDKKRSSLTMTYYIPVNVYNKDKMYTVPSTGEIAPGTEVTSVPGITMTYGGWLTNYNKDKYVSDVYDRDSAFKAIDVSNIYDDKGVHLMDNNYLQTNRIAMNHWGACDSTMVNTEGNHVFLGNFFKFEPSQSGKLTIYGFAYGKSDNSYEDYFNPQAPADLYLIDEKCDFAYKSSDNQGYSKFTVDVHAGKTYSFLSSSPRSGLGGFYFDPTPVDASSVVTLSDKDGIASGSTMGKAARLVYPDRTFKKDTWTSIVLPFSMNEKQVATAFGEGTKVIYFDKLEDNTLKFLHYVYDYIIGGTICFIRPTKEVTGIDLSSAGDYQYITYLNSSLRGENYLSYYSTTDGYSYCLDGGYTSNTLSAYDYYFTSNGTLKYLAKDKTATIKPFRGFFRCSNPMQAKAFTPLMAEGLDDMVTEIESRQVIETVTTEDNSYNLQGQRVSNTYKGVVIQNKKKFLRK